MGRGRVFVCPADEQVPLQRPVSMVHLNELRSAVGDGRLRLYCQPVVPLNAAREQMPAMYEMLLRMIDGKGKKEKPDTNKPTTEQKEKKRKNERRDNNTTLRALRETTALASGACI